MNEDLPHMRAALALARRGLGNAWPNPAVGCVLVKDGRVIELMSKEKRAKSDRDIGPGWIGS